MVKERGYKILRFAFENEYLRRERLSLASAESGVLQKFGQQNSSIRKMPVIYL